MISRFTNFRFLMIFLTFLIIYFLSILSDYFLHLKQYSMRKIANEIITERKINEDRIQIKKAKDEGYVRAIFPYLYHKVPELVNLYIDDLVPVNPQPYKNVYDCNEGYGLTKYKTDRFGFRNNDTVWNKINLANKEKILFIGDSYVHGSCVNYKDIISSNVNDFYNYNVASSGNDPYTYTVLSKLFIPVVKPDYVFLIFYQNDNSPDGEIYLKNLEINDLKKRYFKYENNEIFLSEKIKKVIFDAENFIIKETKNRVAGLRPNVFNRALRYLTLPTIRKTVKVTYKNFFLSNDIRHYKSTKLSIDTLNNECAKHNCVPIYGWIPDSKSLKISSTTKKYKLSIENYLNKNNNFFIDFSKVLHLHEDRDVFATKGTHLSPQGYKLVSLKIKDFLNKNFD